MDEVEGSLKSSWPQFSISSKAVAILMPSGAMILLESEVASPPGDNRRHVSVAAQGPNGKSLVASMNGVVARLDFANS